MSLGTTVLKGSIWTVSAAAANKIVTLLGQLALAWLLVPDDFGLAALALSFSTIATLFSAASFRTLLIQRREDFTKLSSDVFWLGLCVQVIGGLLIFFLAPFGAQWFGDERVASLIRIIAVSTPLSAISMVHWAKLQSDLRFGTVASIQFGQGLLQTGSSVVLATMGFGPFSFVLPRLWVPLFEMLAVRLTAGRIAIAQPSPIAWLALVAPTAWIAVYAFLQSLGPSASVFVLGHMENAEVVGYFSWGYQVAAQAVYLLSINLGQVLFPALSTLGGDDHRLRVIFREPLAAGTALTAFICAIQALLAQPAIELFFDARWLPSAPVIVFLSLGLSLSPMNVVAASTLLSRGSFRLVSVLTAIQVALIAGMAAVGAILGGPVQIALLVALGTLAGHLVMGVGTASQIGLSLASLLGNAGRSLGVALLALASGATAAAVLPDHLHALTPLVAVTAAVVVWIVSAPRVVPELSVVWNLTKKNIFSGRNDAP